MGEHTGADKMVQNWNLRVLSEGVNGYSGEPVKILEY